MPDISSMQDKENRHTPSTAYISSRLGLASPALHTPSHASALDHDAVAAHKPVSTCADAHAISTPSGGVATDFSHLRPYVVDKDHSTPISAAPSPEAALPVVAISDRRRDSSSGPAHIFAQHSSCEADSLAKQQPPTDAPTGVSPAQLLSCLSDDADHLCRITQIVPAGVTG